MYVTDDMITQMEALYGVPAELSFSFDVTEGEFKRIRSSQKHGRNHDVTVYIRKGDQLVVIAKHSYPPGLYRAPSGGLMPGEDFRVGLDREVAEEVGCDVKLDKFILRTSARFTHEGNSIVWRSFVFTADFVRGDFRFTDNKEIREVRLAGWDEFEEYASIMRRTNIGGLHYRAALHDAVQELIA